MPSDVRSLLRQQRAARRIDHPHAAYSDAGKLLCTLCREQLKTESLWNTHLGSQIHKERLQQLQQHHPQEQQQLLQQQRRASRTDSPPPPPPGESSNGRAHKRKLDATDAPDDVDMGDAATIRRKRGRPDIISLASLPLDGDSGGGQGKSDVLTPEQNPSAASSSSSSNNNNGNNNGKDGIMTPPGLTRKSSVTPSQGVELQIPSRPATPGRAHNRDSAGSTSLSGGYFHVQSQNGLSTPVAAAASDGALDTTAAQTTLKDASSFSAAAAAADAAPVDESEWAAFEADIAATTAPYDEDAVISAPAMTSEEAAAKEAEEAAHAERRLQADMDIEFEREEAKRALEDEFDEMRELEERVGKLKEMRAAFLNKRSQNVQHEPEQKPALAHDNHSRDEMLVENRDDEDEDDDDEDDEDDEWDLFRFRR
ncbi:hypothetical protein E4U53_002786 [Claviceps sorghi]|nr:hypothetical protein E4U53_002786 [Claviceps sorghi]